MTSRIDDVEIWLGPPRDICPGVVGLGMTVAKSANAAVVIVRAAVYADGVDLEMLVVTRDLGDEVEARISPTDFGAHPDDRSPVLTLGLAEAKDTSRPSMYFQWGRGYRTYWREGLWVYPVAAHQLTTVRCSWNAAHIPLNVCPLPVDELAAAERRVAALFRGAMDDRR
jgi:hypothetical protein